MRRAFGVPLSLPAVGVAALVLFGVLALAAGIAARTVWLPDDEVTAVADLSGAGPVAVTTAGVLETRAGPVEVSATAADGGPVLLAVGRQADVEAWVEGSAHASVTGLVETERLGVEESDGEAQVPDPATSDLWVQHESGTGTATLTYDAPDGRWLLLAAGNGQTPAPDQLTLTWDREVVTPWSVPLVVTGILLLLAALVLVLLLRYRTVRPAASSARGREEQP